MKTKTLTYNVEPEQFNKLANSHDFYSLLQTGRMLNALATAAEACREVYEKKDTGYRSCEAASFLSRVNARMLTVVQDLWNCYYEEPFFAHFRDMFNGEVRDFPSLTVNRIRPAEFRLISYDDSVSKEIRHMDIYGIDILFPRLDLHPQSSDDVLVLWSQVVPFTGISGEIE